MAVGRSSDFRRRRAGAEGILIFDASVPCDFDGLHAQALELVLRRAGLRTLCLTSTIEPTRLGRALRALDPQAVVLTGRRVTLDAIGRLVYAVRGIVQGVLVLDYRNAVPDTGASTVCAARRGSNRGEGPAPRATRRRLATIGPAAGAPVGRPFALETRR